MLAAIDVDAPVQAERSGSASKRIIDRAAVDGFDSLGDADVLAVLLGCDPVSAARLLWDVGGIDGLARVGLHALGSKPGMTAVKAARLAAAVELGRRAARQLGSVRPILGTSARVAAWAIPRLVHLDHEQMWVLALDGRSGLRAARRVAEGGLHGCSITARDILRLVIREAASAFVLVHNHPSGHPMPSLADIVMTRAVAMAAETLGTPLVDHVIVAGAAHASMLDLGLLVTSGSP